MREQNAAEENLLSSAVMATGAMLIIRILGTLGLFIYLNSAIDIQFVRNVPYQELIHFWVIFCGVVVLTNLVSIVAGTAILLVEVLRLAGRNIFTDPLSVLRHMEQERDKIANRRRVGVHARSMVLLLSPITLCFLAALNIEPLFLWCLACAVISFVLWELHILHNKLK